MAAKECITADLAIELATNRVNNHLQEWINDGGSPENKSAHKYAHKCGSYKALLEWLISANPLWCAETLQLGKIEYAIVRYSDRYSISGEELIRCSRDYHARDLMAGFMEEDPHSHYVICEKFVPKPELLTKENAQK